MKGIADLLLHSVSAAEIREGCNSVESQVAGCTDIDSYLEIEIEGQQKIN